MVKSRPERNLISPWLALVIGNSRLHWAYFVDDTLQQSWHTPHLDEEAIAQLIQTQFDFAAYTTTPSQLAEYAFKELWVASVVPQQTALWQSYGQTHVLSLQQIPLMGIYPTLGIDRALNILGAIQHWNPPLLVIDAGTAITLTGVDATGTLAGGAILPGVLSQLRALHQDTATLPLIRPDLQATRLPIRWAHTTPAAIQSGVMYSILASLKDFAEDWWQQYSYSTIALTGGDGQLLLNLLRLVSAQEAYSPWVKELIWEPDLMFWGVQSTRHHQLNQQSTLF